MIQFRCWYCNRRYAVAEGRQGDRFVCTCERRLRVPRRSGGNSRDRSLVDWVVELTVYGGGGALLGFLLAIVLLSKIPYFRRGLSLLAACTILGFLMGGLFGEAGVNWVGRMMREEH